MYGKIKASLQTFTKIIVLLTVLHTHAKQPIKLAKSLMNARFLGNHGYKKWVYGVIFNATQRPHVFVCIDIQQVICYVFFNSQTM